MIEVLLGKGKKEVEKLTRKKGRNFTVLLCVSAAVDQFILTLCLSKERDGHQTIEICTRRKILPCNRKCMDCEHRFSETDEGVC
jgi:hypothetical protein